MKMIRVIKASTGSVETIVPLFMGFYNTMFEDYWQHKQEIGEMFTNSINMKISEIFPSFRYEFEKVISPNNITIAQMKFMLVLILSGMK